MTKRTINEIEKDYRRIKRVVETKPVTSIKEIGKITNLSIAEIKTSLSKHPRVSERVLEILENNRKKLKAKEQIEKEIINDKKEIKEEHKTKITTKSEYNGSVEKEEKQIVAMISESSNNFHILLIDEELEIPSEKIIKYCNENKDQVELITSDKIMELKARNYGVKAKYIKKEGKESCSTDKSKKYEINRKTTLLIARKSEDKLVIASFNTKYRKTLVISKGKEYTQGIYELKINDEVYLASKKENYMTFAHYCITSLKEVDNCQLIYSRRIYNQTDIDNLPKAEYRSFMRDFRRRYV